MKRIPEVKHYKDYLKPWDTVRTIVCKKVKTKSYVIAHFNIQTTVENRFYDNIILNIQNTFIMKFSKSSLEAAWKLL